MSFLDPALNSLVAALTVVELTEDGRVPHRLTCLVLEVCSITGTCAAALACFSTVDGV